MKALRRFFSRRGRIFAQWIVTLVAGIMRDGTALLCPEYTSRGSNRDPNCLLFERPGASGGDPRPLPSCHSQSRPSKAL